MSRWRKRNAPVVVGVDGSSSALAAARWAAREAALRGAPLELVSAFSWSGSRHIGDLGLGVRFRDAMVESAREAVSAAAQAAAETAPDVEVAERVVDGFPLPLLISESRRAGLLVLGDRGLGGFTSLVVGSVAIGLVAAAECPVVVVRGEASTGPVVVGVDGSPVSEAALEFAFEAAVARKAPLVALHAWTDGVLSAAPALFLDWDSIESDEHRLLAERLAGWGEKYPDAEVQRVVVRDRPAHALIEHATRAQLVVVGSHGRGTAAGLVLGSVSHAVLHHSPCPVAIVRPEPED